MKTLKKGLHKKWNTFFSPNSSTDLRSEALQSQIIGGDAGEDHTQIVGGIQSNYWDLSPPGFGTPARCTNNFHCREKSIAFYDVTMSFGFENQISAFYDNYIFFCTFFCQGTFYVTVS